MNEQDYITGERFIPLADFVYTPGQNMWDSNPLFNSFHVQNLKDVNVVYTHTMYVKQLFDIIKSLPQQFVVVSHNCDVNVDESFVIPENVIVWYSQNVNTINNKLFSLPIGLENAKWTKRIHKQELMSAKLLTERETRNMVYMNHNITTNPAERQKPYDILEGKPWVTTERGRNFENFDTYLDNVYSHVFVVCPAGNGIDTHRTWETLYMGRIPIEKRNLNNCCYADLPICFVDDWEQVTEEWLRKEYIHIKTTEWNLEKLTFAHWANKILNHR